jgi:hypothetical protein
VSLGLIGPERSRSLRQAMQQQPAATNCYQQQRAAAPLRQPIATTKTDCPRQLLHF